MSVFLSHWAATSVYGPSTEDYKAGLSERAEGGAIPGFDIREALGTKGTRSMDRVTAIAVHTIGNLIAGLAERPAPASTATVLGTTAGSVSSIIGFTYDSVTEERPYLVDPARFPNTVMNCAAGRSAIWHQLQGPNATIAGGPHATALAINYGRRLLESGRANAAIVGAVEELSEERQALHGGSGALTEGGAVFMMTKDKPPSRASLEIEQPPAQQLAGGHLDGAIADVLARAGHRQNPFRYSAEIGPGSQDWSHTDAEVVYRPNVFLGGDAGAAAGALALAAMLNAAEPGGPGVKDSAVLLSYDERQVAALPIHVHSGTGQNP